AAARSRDTGNGAVDMNNPLVSAVVPVYNGERYIAEALRSILAQQYRPLEIIAVDDGSTDGSTAIIQSFPEVRYIGGPNRGVAQPRNTGIAEAQGEFIAFLDQDDQWTPDKLMCQIGYMLEHEELGYTVGMQGLYLE